MMFFDKFSLWWREKETFEKKEKLFFEKLHVCVQLFLF